ncbi:MAG: hypothetical protein OEZ36_00930 [Spirochaetota bacterium]|nr:hypothetical protein [Spirochaetota bacterium]
MPDDQKQDDDLFKVIKDSYHGKNVYHEENHSDKINEDLLEVNPSSERQEDKPEFTQKVYLTEDGLNALIKSISGAMRTNHIRSSEILSRDELKSLLNVVEKPLEEDKPYKKSKVNLSEKGLEAIIKAMSHESERAHVKVRDILSDDEIKSLLQEITRLDVDEDDLGYDQIK